MVLKKNPSAEIPAFEDTETAVADAAPAAGIPTQDDVAKATATTAIAKAATTSLAAATKPAKATPAFSEFEDALPEVEFGTFPRITADLGGFEMDKEVVGDTVKLELMSWNHRYVVTPGSDNKEASELVRYSNDGVMLADGSGVTVADYLGTLKSVHGYDNASVKAYIDLTGLLVEKGGEAVAEDDQVVVQVQLSPQSVKQFNGYRITKGIFEARKGVQTGNVLTLKRERSEYNGKKFAYISFK